MKRVLKDYRNNVWHTVWNDIRNCIQNCVWVSVRKYIRDVVWDMSNDIYDAVSKLKREYMK